MNDVWGGGGKEEDVINQVVEGGGELGCPMSHHKMKDSSPRRLPCKRL